MDFFGATTKMNARNGDGPQQASFRPEFVIGVTGHRDISEDDLDGLKVDLQNQLKKIADEFTHVPVRIVSGLAEGADTLVTDIALQLGLEVTAVLPMPLEDFRNDFTGDAAAKFESLISDERIQVTEIPAVAESGDGRTRDDQYGLLADYLVRRSNLLLALWDGEDTGLVGGTSDVVMRYLGDGRQNKLNQISISSDSVESTGNIVSWFPVKRISSETPPRTDQASYLISNGNYDCYWRSEDIPNAIKNRWTGFDAFCLERSSNVGEDLPGYGLGTSSDTSADLAALDAEFIRSDQIARFYQSRSHLMFALFGVLAAGMGLAFLVYAKLLADKNFLWIYIGLFVAGLVGFRYTHRLHLHSKHLAYRVLAETLRVQYYLILTGAGKTYQPRRLLGLTSVDQFARFEWLQEALRVCEPVTYHGHCHPDEILEKVDKGWITDQLKYFEKKRHILHRQHHRLETMKFALLVGSVLGALSLIYFKKALLHLEMAGYDGKAWLVFLMGLLPLWAAIWELYQGKMATRELLWQYANQTKYFRAASTEIRQVSDLDDVQRVVRDLADKALIEIYMWSVHRFHREHEPPAAG